MLLICAVLSSSEDGTTLPAISFKPASKYLWCLNSAFCSALVMIAFFFLSDQLALESPRRHSSGAVWFCKALTEERKTHSSCRKCHPVTREPRLKKKGRRVWWDVSVGKVPASQDQWPELVPWNPCESERKKLSSETSGLHMCTVACVPTTHTYHTNTKKHTIYTQNRTHNCSVCPVEKGVLPIHQIFPTLMCSSQTGNPNTPALPESASC